MMHSRRSPGRPQSERATEIINILAHRGAMGVMDLAGSLHCSPATVRRELKILEGQGVALRRHHGSVSLERTDLGVRFEAEQIAEYGAKVAIAKLLVAFLPEGATIGLNGGTTTTLVARAIAAEKPSVRVVTNAVNIAYELAQEGLDVVVVGGHVGRPNFESTGPLALGTLAGLHMDFAILGAEGADREFGFSTSAEQEAAVAVGFRRVADHVIVAIDHTKLRRRALFRMLRNEEVDYLAADVAEGSSQPWDGLAAAMETERAVVWKVGS